RIVGSRERTGTRADVLLPDLLAGVVLFREVTRRARGIRRGRRRRLLVDRLGDRLGDGRGPLARRRDARVGASVQDAGLHVHSLLHGGGDHVRLERGPDLLRVVERGVLIAVVRRAVGRRLVLALAGIHRDDRAGLRVLHLGAGQRPRR